MLLSAQLLPPTRALLAYGEQSSLKISCHCCMKTTGRFQALHMYRLALGYNLVYIMTRGLTYEVRQWKLNPIPLIPRPRLLEDIGKLLVSGPVSPRHLIAYS
jgi:hypothetical protein